MMLAVWLPHGCLNGCLNVMGAGKTLGASSNAAHPIIDPASPAAVVNAIGLRKWLVTGWTLLVLVALFFFLGSATATVRSRRLRTRRRASAALLLCRVADTPRR